MNKINVVIFMQLLLLASFVAPQASTQQQCGLDEGLQKMISDKFGQWTGGPGGSKKVFVSNISFVDGITKMQLLSDEARLIDQAVQDGMKMAADTDPDVVLNESSHQTPNNEQSVNRFAEISFHPTLTPDDKYATAVADLLDPHSVDVLISGVIWDKDGAMRVSPMGVSKLDRIIKKKDLDYAKRGDLFVDAGGGKLALSQRAREEISKAVKEILEGI